MLEITKKPIGIGKHRVCFVHPEDPRLAIKIARKSGGEKSKREVRFYHQLKRNGSASNMHIPGYHGLCKTNRGTGIVVDLIRNYDGEISRPLNWYLAQGYPIEEFEAALDDLKQSFLKFAILFSQELAIEKLLVKKLSATRIRMIAIDGLGDVAALDRLDVLPFMVRRKIDRRWQQFITRLYLSREVRLQREAQETDSLPEQ